MDWQTRFFLIGIMVVTFAVLWALGRPFTPKLRRWMAAHPKGTETFFSAVLIVWGAGIWYLLISKHDYTNLLAMIMASCMICTGIFFLIRQMLKKS